MPIHHLVPQDILPAFVGTTSRIVRNPTRVHPANWAYVEAVCRECKFVRALRCGAKLSIEREARSECANVAVHEHLPSTDTTLTPVLNLFGCQSGGGAFTYRKHHRSPDTVPA